MFMREKLYRDQQNRFKLRFLSNIMVSPVMLVYLTILDLVFLINQALLVPILVLLRTLTCGLLNFTCLSNIIDSSYEVLFEMQKLEVAGFRRMRTISQLTFETFIQLILQIRMLQYFKEHKESGDQKELGVDVAAIVVSLALASVHGVLEAIFLAMEA